MAQKHRKCLQSDICPLIPQLHRKTNLSSDGRIDEFELFLENKQYPCACIVIKYQFKMKHLYLPFLLLAQVYTQFIRQSPIQTGTFSVTTKDFSINTILQYRWAQVKVVVYWQNIWNEYPENNLYISVKATRFTMLSENKSIVGLPQYFVENNYDGKSNSFRAFVNLSIQLQASIFTANYILVQKNYPLLFKTLQLNVSPSNQHQVHDCSYMLDQSGKTNGDGFKFIHSINGFMIKENTKIQDLELELSITAGPNSRNQGYYLTYFLKETAPFKTVYVSIAIFSIFTVKDKKVYIFDTIMITTAATNSIFLTFNEGLSTFFAGITNFGKVGNNQFQYKFAELETKQIVNSIFQRIVGQRWVGLEKDASNNYYPTITSNFLLYGVSECANFIFENRNGECINKCDYNQQVLKDVVNWKATCQICATENICSWIRCGDLLVFPDEECDLGPHNGQQDYGCSQKCTVNPGYLCNTTQEFTSVCTKECGNAIVTGDEKCDLGTKNGQASGCNADCTVQQGFTCVIDSNLKSVCKSQCGDGKTVGEEQCDLGNDNGKKQFGCTTACTIETGYSCTLSKLISKCRTLCGNGHTTYDQRCDLGDNNGLPQTGCTIDCKEVKGYKCTVEEFISTCAIYCGDGIVMGEEACDLGDQNGKPNSGCTNNCTIQVGFSCENSATPPFCKTKCGDSIVAGKEECDLGTNNNNQGIGCNSDCTKMIGYRCDITQAFGSSCYTVCGDGITAGSEECDNGEYNSPSRAKFYGCDSNCKILSGFNCIYNNAISNCTTKCGDTIVAGNEQCDEGTKNGKPGYPCSAYCLKQEGFYECTLIPFTCTTKCGDGIVAGNEQCDNGASNGAGEVCLSDCTLNQDSTKCIQIDPNFSCSALNMGPVVTKTVRLRSQDFIQS